jgi:hypothetical protein
MATLHLKRGQKLNGLIGVHWPALAALHRQAKVYRHNRFLQKQAQLEEDGYCDVILDAKGHWVDVFGEFSYCDVI